MDSLDNFHLPGGTGAHPGGGGTRLGCAEPGGGGRPGGTDLGFAEPGGTSPLSPLQ